MKTDELNHLNFQIMIKDHSIRYNNLTKLIRQLESRIPSTMGSFKDLREASTFEGALSSKTKKLMALGIAITIRCDGCLAFHIHDVLISGASSEEILETIEVAILMGGQPSVIYGCEALEALNQFIVLEKNG